MNAQRFHYHLRNWISELLVVLRRGPATSASPSLMEFSRLATTETPALLDRLVRHVSAEGGTPRKGCTVRRAPSVGARPAAGNTDVRMSPSELNSKAFLVHDRRPVTV